MNNMDFSTFDRLLLELAFQSQQESQNKRNIEEYIQRCTARALQVKQQIVVLQKDISSCDETILDLQRYSSESSGRFTRFSSLCTVLYSEESLLQSQLENVKKESEIERKKFQDKVSKGKEVFKQYQEQYMEFPLSKKYHSIKQDIDSIQNVVLKLDEQRMAKEKIMAAALEPVPFESFKDWGLQLAKVKKNTNETVGHISEISHTNLELTAKVNELEQKLEYIKKHIENIERQHKSTKNTVPDQATEFQHRVFSLGKTSLTQSRGKYLQTLLLPDLSQKRIRPQREIKLALQSKEPAGRGEKEPESQTCSSTVSSQDTCTKEDNQEQLISDENENSVFPSTRLRHQEQLRSVFSKKQTTQMMGISQTEIRKEQIVTIPNTSKDSGYSSQAELETEDHCNGKVSENAVFALPKVPSFAVPEILSPATKTLKQVKKVRFSIGEEEQNFKKSSDKSFSEPVEKTDKSPYFDLFKTSTPKTPNFSTFASPYRAIKFADQGGSYSSVDISTSSPVKDFESIFGGMEGGNNFAFQFTSQPPQASKEDKDNFGFRLPFGQDMRPSEDFSMNESEQSQSNMKFSFF